MLYWTGSGIQILQTLPLGDEFDAAKLEHLPKRLHSQQPSNLKRWELQMVSHQRYFGNENWLKGQIITLFWMSLARWANLRVLSVSLPELFKHTQKNMRIRKCISSSIQVRSDLNPKFITTMKGWHLRWSWSWSFHQENPICESGSRIITRLQGTTIMKTIICYLKIATWRRNVNLESL